MATATGERHDGRAAARARRRPEPGQRARLDAAAPGRLQRPAAPRAAAARRRRVARGLGARRGRHPADRRAVLGPPARHRGARRRGRLPAQPARGRGPRPAGRHRRARRRRRDRLPRRRRSARFYRPHSGFPAWTPSRRPAGGARRGAGLGGAQRPQRGHRAPRRARRAPGERRLPRHAADVGRRVGPGGRGPYAAGARRRAVGHLHVRRAEPRRGRHAAAPRRPERRRGGRRPAGRRRRRPRRVRDAIHGGTAGGLGRARRPRHARASGCGRRSPRNTRGQTRCVASGVQRNGSDPWCCVGRATQRV